MGINIDEVTFILSELIRLGNALDTALKKEKDKLSRERLQKLEKELNDIQIVGISVVLSISIVYICGVLINFAFFGIERNYVLLSLSLFTLCTTSIGVIRNYMLTKKDGLRL